MGRSTGAGIAKAADHKYPPVGRQWASFSIGGARARDLDVAAPSGDPCAGACNGATAFRCAWPPDRRWHKHLPRARQPQAQCQSRDGPRTRCESRIPPPDRHVPGKPAVEVFGHRFRETRIDALAQRLADADVFARHAKWHDRPPMPLVGRPPPAGWTWRPAPRTHIEHFATDPSSPQKGPQYNIIDGS